jgi:hypothetical protein
LRFEVLKRESMKMSSLLGYGSMQSWRSGPTIQRWILLPPSGHLKVNHFIRVSYYFLLEMLLFSYDGGHGEVESPHSESPGTLI